MNTQAKTQETMATGNDNTHIVQDQEESYDWKIGPCAGMTWSEWAKSQLETGVQSQIQTENDNGDEDHGDEDHGDEDHGDEDHGDEDHGDDDQGDEDHENECTTPRAPQSVRRKLTFGKFLKSQTIQVPKEVSQSEIKPEPAAIEHKAPKKPKTRAERRAEEPEIEDELESSDFLTPQKKQRRTDYWVNQDDLRVKRARAFKNQCTMVAGA